MTNTANFDLIEEHGTLVDGANQNHNAQASSLGTKITQAQTEYFVALLDLNVVKEANTDLATRLFISIAEIRNHITNLESQSASAVATGVAGVRGTFPADFRDLPEHQGTIAQAEESKRSAIKGEYDAVIAILREKETKLLGLLQGKVTQYGDLYVEGQSRLHTGLEAIGRLQYRQAGYAYIGLRLGAYTKAIRDYAASGESVEGNAINAFNSALNWFETPEGIQAGKDLAAYADEVRATTPAPTLQELGVTAPIGAISFDQRPQGGGDSMGTGEGDGSVDAARVNELYARRQEIYEELGTGPSAERVADLEAEARRIDGQLDQLGYSVTLDGGVFINPRLNTDGAAQTDAGYRYELQTKYDNTAADIARLEASNKELATQLYVGSGSNSAEQNDFIARQIGVNNSSLRDLRQELTYIESDIQYEARGSVASSPAPTPTAPPAQPVTTTSTTTTTTPPATVTPSTVAPSPQSYDTIVDLDRDGFVDQHYGAPNSAGDFDHDGILNGEDFDADNDGIYNTDDPEVFSPS